VFSNSTVVAFEPVLRKLRVSIIVGGEAESKETKVIEQRLIAK
jgi:hypothetical protein